MCLKSGPLPIVRGNFCAKKMPAVEVTSTAPTMQSPFSAKSKESREELMHDFPREPDYPSHLGAALNNRALAVLSLGTERLAEVHETLRKAIKYQAQALATHPRDPMYGGFLRNHYVNLAATCLKMKDDREQRRK